MNVINGNVAWLSNYEVLQHLKKKMEEKATLTTQAEAVGIETIKYLESTGCDTQTSEGIKKYMREVVKFNLRKKEKLMIVNHPPRRELDIQLMIEDSEERFLEDNVIELLKIVDNNFPLANNDKES